MAQPLNYTASVSVQKQEGTPLAANIISSKTVSEKYLIAGASYSL